MRSSIELSDVDLPEDEQADLNVVGPDFFATMGIPVLRGRAFEASDLESSRPVMIVNKAFADRYWPGQEAVGKRIKNIGPEGGEGSEIVGVVANFKAHSVREEPAPVMFSPAGQFYLPRMSVVLRTDGDPSALAGPLRAAVARIDPEMPVFNVRTGDEQLGLVLAQERVVAGLLVTFAAIAVLLAATGFYALFAYLTRLRTREFAIRVALGAGRAGLVGSVVARGAAFAALGAGIGLVAAGALSGALADLLLGVAPLDPTSFAAAGLLLVAVAALASYVPARRASRVDANVVLRYE
jgi:predicted permease